MATLQYSLRVSTVAFFSKCWNRRYFASSSFARPIAVATSGAMTPLCSNFNRLSLGLTTSRKVLAYIFRSCEAAGDKEKKVTEHNHLNRDRQHSKTLKTVHAQTHRGAMQIDWVHFLLSLSFTYIVWLVWQCAEYKLLLTIAAQE